MQRRRVDQTGMRTLMTRRQFAVPAPCCAAKRPAGRTVHHRKGLVMAASGALSHRVGAR
eukprot:SAG31_NODE_34012_length_337_cov_1.294118_1_plen_58_part_10